VQQLVEPREWMDGDDHKAADSGEQRTGRRKPGVARAASPTLGTGAEWSGERPENGNRKAKSRRVPTHLPRQSRRACPARKCATSRPPQVRLAVSREMKHPSHGYKIGPFVDQEIDPIRKPRGRGQTEVPHSRPEDRRRSLDRLDRRVDASHKSDPQSRASRLVPLKRRDDVGFRPRCDAELEAHCRRMILAFTSSQVAPSRGATSYSERLCSSSAMCHSGIGSAPGSRAISSQSSPTISSLAETGSPWICGKSASFINKYLLEPTPLVKAAGRIASTVAVAPPIPHLTPCGALPTVAA